MLLHIVKLTNTAKFIDKKNIVIVHCVIDKINYKIICVHNK